MKKIFANHATDKRLIFKIHKQLIQLNIKKKTKQFNQKMGGRPKQECFIFSKKTYRWPMGNEKMLNIANYQRNANQSYIIVALSPHTSPDGHHQKGYN